MSHNQNMPLSESQNQPKQNKQAPFQHQVTIFSSKNVRILYFSIFCICLLTLVKLTYQEYKIRKIIAQNQQQDNLIQVLERNVQTKMTDLSKKREQIEHNINKIGLKARNILKSKMQQYHLNTKIPYLKAKSNQQWGIVRDVPYAKTSLLLAINNLQLQHRNIHIETEINQLKKNQYQRLSKIYDFTLPQKKFCVFSNTINNNKNFGNIYNLQSIFNQNYSNYRVVIIDDASTDLNFQMISQYIKQHPVSQQVHLIKNEQRKTAIPNIYKALTQYCLPDQIFLMVDGDDQLLGINVFKIFNSVYSTKNVDVVYSNLIESYVHVKPGWSRPYTQEQKKNNMYRQKNLGMFPLRTFKVSTFLKIDPKDLKDDNGKWFMEAYDIVIMPMVLELSCGRNEYIDEYIYLYNYGDDDVEVDSSLKAKIIETIRARKKYECSK